MNFCMAMDASFQKISIADYNYLLPDAQIAAFPLAKRDDSRLLVYKSGSISDSQFVHLPQLLPDGATLVVNNTKVIAARILFQKATGGQIEIFCLEPHESSIEEALHSKGSSTWQCLVGGASKWKPGLVLEKQLAGGGMLAARYLAKAPDHFIIGFSWDEDRPFSEILQDAGAIPLPPYIKRAAQTDDHNRYQTVFAQTEGSVAAPTAALHFTPQVFAALAEKNIHTAPVTLHVGAGTFRPVKAETIGEHPMHAEHFQVSKTTLRQLISATHIVAVGTTSLRTLESLFWLGVKLRQANGANSPVLELGQWECYGLEAGGIAYRESLKKLLAYLEETGREHLDCRTSLLIVPGYAFQSAQTLVTNFHQPQSTLLLLVAAFIGEDWRRVYQHALEQGYRFLSYGDSSVLFREERG